MIPQNAEKLTERRGGTLVPGTLWPGFGQVPGQVIEHTP